MKGFKTIGANLASAILVATLTWVVGFDWNGAGVAPAYAILVVNAANIVLRFVTHTPIFSRF